MKADTQHLEFLISQYVDGSLDGAAKRTLEQQLAVDPAARNILKEYRDLQDVLDDYGNRIPLINWTDFDNKLAARIEKETVGSASRIFWQRWARPVAAAACLLLAASLGYSWHAYKHGSSGDPTIAGAGPATNLPAAKVVRVDGPLADMRVATSPSIRKVTIETPGEVAGNISVAIGSPHEMAPESAIDSAMAGMGGDLSNEARRALRLPTANQPSSVTAGLTTQPRDPFDVP